ncbi:hypothetical protein [Streptomyces sp. NPDC088246]|uniref:hypothetical protein n=1 Tax=Streptomyces sp. NPDC088246 TaxID=3365842 RepID=UPI003816F778
MISRRTGLAVTAAALLTGASGPAATAAAPHRAPGLRSRLRSDVDAIRATGATGVRRTSAPKTVRGVPVGRAHSCSLPRNGPLRTGHRLAPGGREPQRDLVPRRTHLGIVSESGVTPDGARAATSATFTLRMGDPAQDAQDLAALRLVDRALTG